MRCDSAWLLVRRAKGAMGWYACCLSALGMLAGCGSDDPQPLGQPPEDVDRELPTLQPPDHRDGSVGEEPGPTLALEDAGLLCCATLFQMPQSDSGEAYVVLRGDGAPLDEGVELQLQDGVWRVEVCLPPTRTGTYYFEFGLPSEDDDGGVVDGMNYLDVRHDPGKPTVTDDFGRLVNTFDPTSTCD